MGFSLSLCAFYGFDILCTKGKGSMDCSLSSHVHTTNPCVQQTAPLQMGKGGSRIVSCTMASSVRVHAPISMGRQG